MQKTMGLCAMIFLWNTCYKGEAKAVAPIGSAVAGFRNPLPGVSYFVHPLFGNDSSDGRSRRSAFKSLQRLRDIPLHAGDRIVLACGQYYAGTLQLSGIRGTPARPIMVTSVPWNAGDPDTKAVIDFRGQAEGILIQNCSFIIVSHLQLCGDGYGGTDLASGMRCGMLVRNTADSIMQGIRIFDMTIKNVFFENKGYTRGQQEVRTANGLQKYGWGIRVVSAQKKLLIRNLDLSACRISNVSHTGLQLTGTDQNISHVKITGNDISYTGGPGVQMSGVKEVYVGGNTIDHSGSNNDSRKWGRGSGLWTWGSSRVTIEKNRFMHAHGPGDSDGAHIDFNCDNIIIQYNLSYHNAGGFCEILGNTYNCTYRYNVSVNDGYRVKGKDNAFQEGKIIWLSGYVGNGAARKGPVNTYIYNNTIYCDSSIIPKIAIDNSSSKIWIANNLFCVKNAFRWVSGDQSRPDTSGMAKATCVLFTHNLFLNSASVSRDLPYRDASPLYGSPRFKHAGDSTITSYVTRNSALTKMRGIAVVPFPDGKGHNPLSYSLQLHKDILGNPVIQNPLGAIVPKTIHFKSR